MITEGNALFKPIMHLNYFLAPPSYEECMFGASNINDSEDNEHIFGTTGYFPRYPTYTLPTTLPGSTTVGWAAQ
jgi:hypothetical protein